nr:MAG TPA: hypothetical protein [Caudoviricetes sp.]
MKAYCLFEQSGTFKNEFKKLGIDAYDYDIRNDFGQTDFVVDLFAEIQKAYEGWESIFDKMGGSDIIMAFFPCTRFEAKVPLSFRGEAIQQKNWSDLKKLQYSMKLHGELHELYEKLCELTVVAERKGLRMVIENPVTQPHYLTTYWCIKPSVIDKDRTNDGDYYKKPTQYFFIGFKPSFNIVMEPLELVKTRTIKNAKATETTSVQVERSMMHPQYARRFIKKYILPNESKG